LRTKRVRVMIELRESEQGRTMVGQIPIELLG
jgi:hypothetical protein